VIFVINGSGGGDEFSANLSEAVRECGARLCVRTMFWGNHDVIEDHSNTQEHFRAGTCLAAMIKTQRYTCPEAPIVVMGHSAGTHVVLVAAAMLPPDMVDGIILFAPSVARTYDLRPALRASRCGINTYYSAEDGGLELADDLLGITADGQRGARMAGITGFCSLPAGCPGAELYCKLRQYAWSPALEELGNLGGHSGWLDIRYLRSCIVPMFAPCCRTQD
jgi:pimeloyl-ACP methyl ester carboxylesterase